MATMRLAMTKPRWSTAYNGLPPLSPTFSLLRARTTFTTRSSTEEGVPLSLSSTRDSTNPRKHWT